MHQRAKVIASFPGTGKSWIKGNTKMSVLDCDSSKYSKKKDGSINPKFPENYIAMIYKNIGHYDYILIACHIEVRDGLHKKGVAYSVVAPDIGLTTHYVDRYVERKSTEGFIWFMTQNWDSFITELMADNRAINTIMLARGQYLNDYINEL